MTEFIATVTSFSVDGPLVNVFDMLKPVADVAGAVASLLGLAPTK